MSESRKYCPFCQTDNHHLYNHCPGCMSLNCQTPKECAQLEDDIVEGWARRAATRHR